MLRELEEAEHRRISKMPRFRRSLGSLADASPVPDHTLTTTSLSHRENGPSAKAARTKTKKPGAELPNGQLHVSESSAGVEASEALEAGRRGRHDAVGAANESSHLCRDHAERIARSSDDRDIYRSCIKLERFGRTAVFEVGPSCAEGFRCCRVESCRRGSAGLTYDAESFLLSGVVSSTCKHTCGRDAVKHVENKDGTVEDRKRSELVTLEDNADVLKVV
jgi:hypothetical protein